MRFRRRSTELSTRKPKPDVSGRLMTKGAGTPRPAKPPMAVTGRPSHVSGTVTVGCPARRPTRSGPQRRSGPRGCRRSPDCPPSRFWKSTGCSRAETTPRPPKAKPAPQERPWQKLFFASCAPLSSGFLQHSRSRRRQFQIGYSPPHGTAVKFFYTGQAMANITLQNTPMGYILKAS